VRGEERGEGPVRASAPSKAPRPAPPQWAEQTRETKGKRKGRWPVGQIFPKSAVKLGSIIRGLDFEPPYLKTVPNFPA